MQPIAQQRLRRSRQSATLRDGYRAIVFSAGNAGRQLFAKRASFVRYRCEQRLYRATIRTLPLNQKTTDRSAAGEIPEADPRTEKSTGDYCAAARCAAEQLAHRPAEFVRSPQPAVKMGQL